MSGSGRHDGGGSGAVLGVRVLRYSGVQGATTAIAALMQLATLFVIGAYLGPGELGRFALLFFGAGLLGHVLTIACKPGTLRRTFGAGDDDEGDDEGDEDTSATPKRSLGTGLTLALLLATLGAAVAIALRGPLAELLLGDRGEGDLVVWAALLGATTVVFRIVSIVIWFERRPGAFMACELTRPVISLVAAVALLAGGAGVEAVVAAAAGGAAVAAAIGLVLLRGSFTPALDLREVGLILQRGMYRAPIMMSFWAIGNADVFVLSRFVTDTDLGVYTLASRAGFIAAFAPQGFRVALRPLRKAAIFQAVEDQYGRAEQRGQLLGYFVLLCVSAVLAMLLLSGLLVEIAPASFADAAPLIPLAAGGMVLPALLRTVSQQTTWPGRTKLSFIVSAVVAATVTIVGTALLAPEIDAYAAPIGMFAGLIPPCIYLFVRCQRSKARIRFPYRQVATAVGVAVALGAAFLALPSLPVAAELLVVIAFAAAYLVALPALGVIPEAHRPALAHMVRSLVSGRPDRFNPRKGLRALEPERRAALRAAVEASWARAGTARGAVRLDGEVPARRLVRSLRAAGRDGGVRVAKSNEHDALIAEFLFSDAPTAVRNATMRKLLDKGVKARELRTLEDLVAHLAKVPDGAWAGERGGSRRRLRR